MTPPPPAYPNSPPPVAAPPVVTLPPPPAHEQTTTHRPEVIIYSHSPLFYWWPVWAVGFLMTAITYFQGERFVVGRVSFWFYPGSNLGVVFFLLIFLVILITNVSVRGLAAVIVILVAIIATMLFAFFGLWDLVLGWLGDLKIQMNLGAFFWFSVLMFLTWALTVFVFDRLSYWRFTPGQVTNVFLIGAAAKSYDTENLILEKYRDDVFRHWILGLGSGDLHIRPYGARSEEIGVPNVQFIGSKIRELQRLIATEPEQAHSHQ